MAQIEIVATEGGRRLALPPVLDLLMAEPLREALRESVVLGGTVEIDAGGVQRMSTPCIQVLIAGTAALADKGIGVVVRAPSETFMNAFYELGLFAVVAGWDIES